MADLADRHAAVRAEIDSVAEQLQAVQTRRATEAESQFTIVPFDVRTGTTRLPIVIECLGDRLLFVSEGITLTAHDLNGFIPHFNPLSAGVRTLAEGHARDGDGRSPYVLLIVRPEGTIAFYAARILLQPLNIPFGYELVGADQEFTWPSTDRALVKECREAIEEVLRERSRVAQLSRVSGRYEDPIRVIGRGGEFRLDEVDRMRQPGRSIQFGDRRIDRGEYTAPPGVRSTVGTDRRRGGFFARSPADREGDEHEARSSRDTGDASPERGTSAPRFGGPPPSAASNTEELSSSSVSRRPASGGWTSGFGAGQGTAVQDPLRWRPPRSSGVAIIRDVEVELSTNGIRVGSGEARPISADIETEALARHLAEGLEAMFAEWGRPPHGFYWKPQLKFVITARSAPLSAKLTPVVKAWGLTSTLDYASRFNASPHPR